MASFKREVYHIGDMDAISYELTDGYGHTIQLDPSEAQDLIAWLDTLRGQISADLHPDISEPQPDA